MGWHYLLGRCFYSYSKRNLFTLNWEALAGRASELGWRSIMQAACRTVIAHVHHRTSQRSGLHGPSCLAVSRAEAACYGFLLHRPQDPLHMPIVHASRVLGFRLQLSACPLIMQAILYDPIHSLAKEGCNLQHAWFTRMIFTPFRALSSELGSKTKAQFPEPFSVLTSTRNL